MIPFFINFIQLDNFKITHYFKKWSSIKYKFSFIRNK